ncbi:MAG: MerR family DNA-binding transcriptional regulator [Bacteroidales bacterium]|jgi:DNA-binding transcriptional MerR regulator|nr:MerR family DNA-binding transcriptional regulator [Bacteroidales bacterium]
MNSKDGLLSIGEMAKLTGAGIQALRYYERKNILKPAYVDSYSGYRYYSLEQSYFVDIITVCVELGIPLKELKGLFESEDPAVLSNFFLKNKETAEKKIKILKIGLSLMSKALKKLEINKPYKIRQIHAREIPEKFYYVKPCGYSIRNINRIKQLLELQKQMKAEFDINGIEEQLVLLEYGFLCEYSPRGIEYYVFTEIPKCLANESTKTIPSGTYFFRQDMNNKIEDAPAIFEQHITNKDYFFVIEVEELISGKSRLNKPIHELRLITF